MVNDPAPPLATQSTDPAPMRWHLIVGILGLLYGLAGLVAHLFMISSMFFFESMMKMAGMGDLAMPTALRLTRIGLSSILLVLGVILVIGSILVVMRRPLGATLMKFWAGARVLLTLVELLVAFLQMPTQLDFQMEVVQAQRAMLKDRGVPEERLPPDDREATQKQLTWTAVGFSVVGIAFPIFVGVLFTNRRKLDDVEAWRSIVR